LNSIVINFLKLLEYFNFQFLSIGVVGGYLYFFDLDKISNLTKSKYLYLVLISIIFVLYFFKIFDVKVNHFILGILFLFLIYFTINPLNKWTFRNKKLSYLGKISYGIYMYHVTAIFLVYPFTNKYFELQNKTTIFNNIILYLGTFLITIISYEFFESKFIKIKDLKFRSN